MKIGIRKPSIKRRIKARTTGRIKRKLKSSVNPLYGKKGMGYINNPKKAEYNKVYNKTTVGIDDPIYISNKKKKTYTMNDIEKNYEIIDDKSVLMDGIEYSRFMIRMCMWSTKFIMILLIVLSIFTMPIGLFFLFLALLVYLRYDEFKKIYIEMQNYKNDNN